MKDIEIYGLFLLATSLSLLMQAGPSQPLILRASLIEGEQWEFLSSQIHGLLKCTSIFLLSFY